MSCTDEPNPDPSDTLDTATDTADATDATADLDSDAVDVEPDVEEATCDDSRRPIVLAHGFLASGDTWSPHTMRFASNGWCADRIFAFDWNTLNRTIDHAELLDAFIDEVLAETGAEQVDLGGHSAGGGLGYEYLDDAEQAAKVAHYAHIASFIESAPAGPDGDVPTLNLWSSVDLTIDSPGEIEGAENFEVVGADHYSVATSEASFGALYKFFTDGETPQTTTIVPEESIKLAGRALSLGENVVPEGSTVSMWRVETESGARLDDQPLANSTLDASGDWGPFDAEPGVAYEFEVRGDEESIPVTYFRRPFVRTDSMVYLRTLPAPGSIAGALLGVVPFDHEATVLIVFSSSQALISGTNSLTVDGVEIVTDETAAPEDTTIAFFLFDEDEDLESSLEVVGLFESFPFLAGLDLALGAETIAIELDGRELNVFGRTGPEGAVVAVFE
ncbi:MAG: pimeloyl-ACP methyl ester carboxylesterase [Bradymonadia bacterium]|jgi:pimeloyl-ACP methyl ester carboxylesterase